MDQYRNDSGNSFQETFRMAASGLGIILILIGLWYSISLFNSIHSILKEPGSVSELIKEWENIIGSETLVFKFSEGDYNFSRSFAAIILAGGFVILVRLALAFMGTGAKIVSWTSSEREAVKRILQYSLPTSQQSRNQNKETNRHA